MGAPTVTAPTLIGEGARLATDCGEIVVETLSAGAMLTGDGADPIPLRAATRTTLDAEALWRQPQDAPVRIRAGAFGPGLPRRDLILALNSCVLVAADGVARLVRVEAVLGQPGVALARDLDEVRYCCLRIDGGCTVFANGLGVAGPRTVSSL